MLSLMIVNSTRSVPGLKRGLQVLALLSGPLKNGATATELQQRSGIPPASFFRILSVLHASKLVGQDGRNGHYQLGTGAMELGFTARAASNFVRAAQPVLREISGSSHHMSELAVATGDWMLMILETWLAERSSLKIQSRPGMFFPLNHLHAPGLCYLAFDTDFGLQRFRRVAAAEGGRQRLGLPQLPSTTLGDDCERWRRLGYCWLKQTSGTARVTAPVYESSGPRKIRGALSIVTETDELTPLRRAQWGSLLMDAAARLQRAASG